MSIYTLVENKLISLIMNPLVSVIIPNYNHAQYLDFRIQSILNQSYKNFEIIILDDCSTDNSKEVIEKYRNNNQISHIIYNEKNSGSTFIQWDKGIRLSKGEFIWIAESDDICENNILEVLLNYYKCDPKLVISFCKSQFINEKGEFMSPLLSVDNDLLLTGSRFIKNNMTCGNKICNASAVLFRKSALEKINLDYKKFVAAGDKLYWIEIAKQGNVAMCGQVLNYFRQHQNKVSPKKVYDGTVFKEDHLIYCYLKKEGFINCFNDFFIRNYYINIIYRTSFINKETMMQLLKLWNKPKVYNLLF